MAFIGDLQTNMRLDSGVVKCHSTTDLELTSSGDLALITDDDGGMRQRILIWLAVPPGELFDPEAGCPVYDYFHTKMTPSMTQSLANAMTNSFKYLFPELNIRKVDITRTDYSTLFLEVYTSTSLIRFLFSKKDVDSVNKNMWDIWAQNNLCPLGDQYDEL
jgi:hypothetical protein